MIDFLNIYLDGLVLSHRWMTLFMREWLFEYKTDFFEWTRIQTVSHTQNSFWDKVFVRWDITLTLEHWIEYPFENVNFPKKQVEKIMKYKNQYAPTVIDDASDFIGDDKMSIVAEALSEVVKEYMEKKSSDEDDYEDY